MPKRYRKNRIRYPRKVRRVSRYRKRGIYKRRGSVRRTIRKEKTVQFPRLRRVIFKYTDPQITTITPTTGYTYGVYYFRLNDVYDPRPEGGTYGTPGFAEHMEFFKNFRVDMVHIKASFIATNKPAYVFIKAFTPDEWVNKDNPSTMSAFALWRQRLTQPYSIVQPLRGSPQGKITLNLRVPIRKLLGLFENYRSNPTYCGADNGSPNSVLWVGVGTLAYDGTAAGATSVMTKIDLRYYTMLFNRKNLYSSTFASGEETGAFPPPSGDFIITSGANDPSVTPVE